MIPSSASSPAYLFRLYGPWRFEACLSPASQSDKSIPMQDRTKTLDLEQPVNLMGPNVLIAYSLTSDEQYREAEQELRNRRGSYKNLPKTEFKSILSPHD